MPYLLNPTGSRLTCYLLGRLLEPEERVEITDEQADTLRDGPVFVVEDAKVAPNADEASEPEAEKPKRPAARKTVKRGAKHIEVSGAPESEKR